MLQPTQLIAPWNATVYQVVHKSRNIIKPEGSSPCQQQPDTCHYAEPREYSSRYPMLLLLRFILSLSSHLRVGLPSIPFLQVLLKKILCAFLISSIRATCPAHLILIHSIIFSSIWWAVRIITLLIMQFSPVSCHFLPLRPRYLPQYPIFEHPQPMPFPETEDQVSHPYKTTANIIINITVYYSPTNAQVIV